MVKELTKQRINRCIDRNIITRISSYSRQWVSELIRVQYNLQNKFQEPVPEDIPFPCDTQPGYPGARSATRPNTVHRLRAGDIDVIGAMGDSLTAGSGSAAANVVEVSIENRGMSWSGGEFTPSLGILPWRLYTLFGRGQSWARKGEYGIQQSAFKVDISFQTNQKTI